MKLVLKDEFRNSAMRSAGGIVEKAKYIHGSLHELLKKRKHSVNNSLGMIHGFDTYITMLCELRR